MAAGASSQPQDYSIETGTGEPHGAPASTIGPESTHTNVPWAIATSGALETARFNLDMLDVPPSTPVVTRDRVERAKPDPDLFLAAAKELGIEGPNAWVVGDSVWDMLAARRANSLGVGLLSGGYGEQELDQAGAYRVYADPADMLQHLDELGVREGWRPGQGAALSESRFMFLILLFLHLLAVAALFAAIGIELAAHVALQRAQTVSQARAALSNSPLVGPIMGFGVVLLVAMGVAMVYASGFGWQPWTTVVLILTIILVINGRLTNGKRGEALYRLAQNATDGPITPELEAARADRVLTYSIFMTACELIAALYVMSNKPGLAGSILTIVIAAAVAFVPMALVTQKKSAPRSNVSA